MCVCVNMYIKRVCEEHTGQKIKRRRKNQLRVQRWRLGSSRGYVTVGWMYRERNVLENEAVVQKRLLFIPSEVAEK